jgi:hypothetical protein
MPIGPDGRQLVAGDTYHSLETISEEPTPDGGCAEAVLIEDPAATVRPVRRVVSRPGLPLTEAVGRIDLRVDDQELRIVRLETLGALLAAVVAVLVFVLSVLLVLEVS